MRRIFPIVMVVALALVAYAPVVAGPTPSPAKPGQFYANYGWGSHRSESAGFVYGRNASGTGPAYDFHPPVSGESADLVFGYVLPDATRWPAWLGENPRLELALGYADAGWSGNSRSPTGTKVPFLDNRAPNLQVATVPANQDEFSQELNRKSYDLMLTTDYRPLPWNLSVTPFVGVSRIARRETSQFTSIDPTVGMTDLVVSERLDTDYHGARAGATVVAPLGSGWRLLLGASRSWLRAEAELKAEQAFLTYPAPPGLAMQLGDVVNGRSADRTTYLIGMGHDSGWARVDLIVERSTWSYIPIVINPMLYTDPAAHLDAKRAEDTAFRVMFTVPIGR